MFKLSIAANKLLKSSVVASEELIVDRSAKNLFAKSTFRYADCPAALEKTLVAMQKSVGSQAVKNLIASNVPYRSIFNSERAAIFFDALFDESAYKMTGIEEINAFAIEFLEILDDIAKNGNAEFVVDERMADSYKFAVMGNAVPDKLKQFFAEAGCFSVEEKVVALQTLVQFIHEFDYLTKDYPIWCQVVERMIAFDINATNQEAFGSVVEKTVALIVCNNLGSSYQVDAIISLIASASKLKEVKSQ